MELGLKFLDGRERFVPVKLATLRETMFADPRLSAADRKRLAALFEMIAARFHAENLDHLEAIQKAYEPFDPDVDTVATKPRPDATALPTSGLAEAFERLLGEANYRELSHQQIVKCAEYQAYRHITVKASLADYSELKVYFRGLRHEVREYRPWYAPWKVRQQMIHVFARVALLVRLVNKQPDAVFLKLFKNVVAEDLEMLLPDVRIRMRFLDQLKIGGSVLGGVVTASWKVSTAVALSPWVLLIVAGALGGACVRGITGFLKSKALYIHKLTANLYFQNLANNSSILAHLVESAEAEQCKELLLAYFLLYVERGRGLTQAELDRQAEQWLSRQFGVTVDFDTSGAVEKLIDKELLVRCSGTTAAAVLKVCDLRTALRRLDEAWDTQFDADDAFSLDPAPPIG